MNLSEQLHKEKENPFHFYIISGNAEKNIVEVFDFLQKKLSFKKEGNPDLHQFSGTSLAIADAREIKRINSRTKDVGRSYRVFIINVQKIDSESQNALLKTLEEPSEKTLFFLFVPRTNFILDTIVSRARIIQGHDNESSERAITFLQDSFINREKTITKISKSSTEPAEVRDNYLHFLTEVEMALLEKAEQYKEKIGGKNFTQIYRTFLSMKQQAEQKGSGLKYIATFLAITIPKI